jgi:hypothetical protein
MEPSKIPGIKLKTGLGCRDVQNAAGRRRRLARRAQAVILAIHHKVVVVSSAIPELFVVLRNSRADGHWLSKIERSALDGGDFAGRNRCGIDRRVSVGIDRQLVIENVTRAAGEIEVGMMRQIDQRRFVRGRQVIHN